ncbi:MAG: TolC family protein [Chitinophagaceae bacterium]
MRFVCKQVWIFFFFCFHFTKAQEIFTVQDAIDSALKRNYDIELVRLDSTAYAIDYAYANAAFLPALSGSASRAWNSNNQEQRLSDGTKRERDGIKSNNLIGSINLNWRLFDGMRMFITRKKLAEFQRLGEFAVKDQVVTTVAGVINNYYDIVRQKQQLKAIEELMSINDERVTLADRKFSVGLGAKPELLQAKVDLNAQRAAQLTQQTLIAQLKEQLNQLIGLPITRSYEVSDTIPVNTNLQLGLLRNDIELTNPSLLLAKKNIDISTLSLQETRADLLPVLSFNSAYNFSRTNNEVVINTFTPLFNLNRGLNYGFSVSVPIFNGFNTRRLIRQAGLDIRLQEVVYANQLSQIDVTLNNSFKDYELYKKLLVLEEDNILLAKENVNIALERFRLGVSTNLELREAQISLEQGYNRLIAARYNTKVAETELLRLQGHIVR